MSVPIENQIERPLKEGRTDSLRALGLLSVVLALICISVNLWLMARWVQHQAQGGREHAFWVLCQPGEGTAERARAFKQLLADKHREWRSANLGDLNLANEQLETAVLKNAAFARCNLSHAHLSESLLNGASFSMADLSEADLTRADASEGQFYRARLISATLNQTILRAASLQEIQAAKARCLAADFSEADCSMADFSEADLTGANFSGARLEGAKFIGANLSLARFYEANIKEADFSGGNWWRARGFTTAQLDLLKKKFPPGANSPAAVRADYEKFLAANR